MTDKTFSSLEGYISTVPTESKVRDYVALLKLRVMSLVVFTGACGIYLAPGNVHPFIAFIAILCITLGSGAASCLNMWYDRDIDAIMTRTKNRPIPMGKIAPQAALEFGIVLASLSVIMMAVSVHIFAAFLLSCAILFYFFVYTMGLKRRTPQNIVIGGAAGAFPPLIGWSAVTNSLNFDAFLLFSIIFIWTAPHFWALALYRSEDYARAGVPMLPVISGRKVTQNHIIAYTVLLFFISLLPLYRETAHGIYAINSIILGIIFLYYTLKLRILYSENLAKKTFAYSIFYLFALFLSLLIDKSYPIIMF